MADTFQIIKASTSESNDIGAISTGLPQLDRIIGIGGIPKRRITEILGNYGVGKTTLCLFIVREAQKQGIECVWADVEWSWDNDYADRFGVDTDALGLIQAPYAEQTLDLLEEHARENKNCLYIVDSVGALHSRVEAEKNAGEKTIGSQASALAVFCRKLTPVCSMNNHALVFINHEYKEVGAQRPVWLPSGGQKLAYHKSLSLRLTKAWEGATKVSKEAGMVVEVEVKKNKLASTVAQKCEIQMIYGKGWNPVSDILQDALDKGVITRTGNTFFIGEEKIGTKKLLDARMETEEFVQRIKDALAENS